MGLLLEESYCRGANEVSNTRGSQNLHQIHHQAPVIETRFVWTKSELKRFCITSGHIRSCFNGVSSFFKARVCLGCHLAPQACFEMSLWKMGAGAAGRCSQNGGTPREVLRPSYGMLLLIIIIQGLSVSTKQPASDTGLWSCPLPKRIVLVCFGLSYSHCAQAEHPAWSRVTRMEP